MNQIRQVCYSLMGLLIDSSVAVCQWCLCIASADLFAVGIRFVPEAKAAIVMARVVDHD